MNTAEVVTGQLAFFAYREGQRLAPGCRDAMKGIAHCMRNRVEAGMQNGDWMRLLTDVGIQSASTLEEMDFRSYVDLWDTTFRWLHKECSGIYDGTVKDTVTISPDTRWAGGKGMPMKALFWANLQHPIRPWFLENIVRKPQEHPRTADAGTVTFFG